MSLDSISFDQFATHASALCFHVVVLFATGYFRQNMGVSISRVRGIGRQLIGQCELLQD